MLIAVVVEFNNILKMKFLLEHYITAIHHLPCEEIHCCRYHQKFCQKNLLPTNFVPHGIFASVFSAVTGDEDSAAYLSCPARHLTPPPCTGSSLGMESETSWSP